VDSQPERVVIADRARTQTRYVTVPATDDEAEALKEAMRREVELNPEVAPYLSRVENVAQQLLSGRKAAQGNRARQAQSGWKND
jgi:hypothetical protein